MKRLLMPLSLFALIMSLAACSGGGGGDGGGSESSSEWGEMKWDEGVWG